MSLGFKRLIDYNQIFPYEPRWCNWYNDCAMEVDIRGILVRFLAQEEDCSPFKNVQTSLLVIVGKGVLPWWIKRPEREVNNSPHLVPT